MNPDPLPLNVGPYLAKKVIAVMRDVKAEDMGDSVIALVRKSLVKNNLCVTCSQKSCTEIVHKTLEGNEQTITKLEMEFELTDADSGESKVMTFYGYGYDKSDGGVHKAMQGAEKSFLSETFLIDIPMGDSYEK